MTEERRQKYIREVPEIELGRNYRFLDLNEEEVDFMTLTQDMESVEL